MTDVTPETATKLVLQIEETHVSLNIIPDGNLICDAGSKLLEIFQRA